MQKARHLCFIIALSLPGAASAQAPTYPTKPARIVVGFAPGGGVDIMGRYYAQRFTESLGQAFVVENRPGAGGNIATDLIAKASPDGYTLLMTSIVHTINAGLYSKLPYDPVKDFSAVDTVAATVNAIAVHPSSPINSVRDLINLAREKPGAIAYSSAGNGTLMHVGMELFRSSAGINLLHIPYNGSGPSVAAVLGGQVPVLSVGLGPIMSQVKAGKLRVIAVTGTERSSLLPEVPTIAEAAGLPGFEVVGWMGLLAPAGTPPAIVNRLNGEIERLQQRKETRDWLETQSYQTYRHTPASFSEMIRNDIARWGKLVREIGAKVD